MIPPRVEFVLISAALAFVLALLAYVILLGGVDTAQWGRSGWESMKVTPAALIATLFGAWWTTVWHRRALQKGRRWTSGGFTLRTLLLAFTCFPLVLTIWFGGMSLVDETGGGLAWVVPAALLFTGFAIVLGAVPAFILEYFVCRRYLKRTAAITTGSA